MKLKNTSIIFAVVVIFSIMLTGCGDPVKDDIVNFDKSCGTFTQVMQDIQKELTSADSSNVSKILTEDAQKLESTKKSVEAIEVKTQELKDVRKILIDALDLTAQGCKTIGEAAKDPLKADQNAVKEAQDKLTKGSERFTEFSKKYEELAKKHGLEVQK